MRPEKLNSFSQNFLRNLREEYPNEIPENQEELKLGY